MYALASVGTGELHVTVLGIPSPYELSTGRLGPGFESVDKTT